VRGPRTWTRASPKRRRAKAGWVCALLAGALLATVGVTAGCSAEDDRTLVVLGPWTDGEEKPFVAALAKIGERTGRHYAYEGTRSLRETLVAQLRAGAPPDVALLNSLGDLAGYAQEGDAKPLPDKIAQRALRPWAPRFTVPDATGEAADHAYAVPVRVDLKSIVWSRPGATAPGKAPVWCLGMASGPTSGWPGTDWIEDLLLQRWGYAVYDSWATGDLPWTDSKVRTAWQDWGKMVTALDPKAGQRALSTSFESIGGGHYGLLNTGDCTHEHAAAFIRRHYQDDILPEPTSSYLPDVKPLNQFEVSGDLAAVFKESDAAWELMAQLTSDKTRADWTAAAKPEEQPFFAGDMVPGDGPQTKATAAALKLLDGASRVCFDASDSMPPTLRVAFQRAVLEFLEKPKDEKLLSSLLEQLEAERQLQRSDRALVPSTLCDRLPGAP
jgi:alpha-glucoside transport system substrate-binding protein